MGRRERRGIRCPEICSEGILVTNNTRPSRFFTGNLLRDHEDGIDLDANVSNE
jgi:hypothetical protein